MRCAATILYGVNKGAYTQWGPRHVDARGCHSHLSHIHSACRLQIQVDRLTMLGEELVVLELVQVTAKLNFAAGTVEAKHVHKC